MSRRISERLALSLVALSCAAIGCRQLVDADGFSVADDEPNEPATPKPVMSWLSSACQACIQKVCVAQLASCEAEPACRAFDTCYGAHPSPSTRNRCSANNPDGGTYMQLGRCVTGSCGDECDGGQAYDCLGEPFETVSPKSSSFELGVGFDNLFSGMPVPDLAITACKRFGWTDLDCVEGKEAEAVTDAAGSTTLRLPFTKLGIRQPWDGFLTVSGPNTLPELRLSNIPYVADIQFRFYAMTRAEYALIASRYAVASLPDHGSMTIDLLDCESFRARGVAVELEPSAPETRRFYSNGGLSFDESATETGADAYAIFANVPAGLVKVKVTVAATGARLAEVEAPIRPGTRTALVVEPKSVP
jgi:hypothetical protein